MMAARGWGRRNGELVVSEYRVSDGKMNMFWKWMVVIIVQHEST